MTTQAPQRRTTLTSEDHRAGDVWWVDYAALDIAAAKSFFSKMFGWTYTDAPNGGGYQLASASDHLAAGLMDMPDNMREMGMPPVWTPYVNVDSITDTCTRIAELGGTVQYEPMQVDEAGWMAVAADPTDAVFGLWQPAKHTGAGLINSPGALCWSEVRSSDMAAAKEFYCALFGWDAKDLNMGPVPYVQFALGGNPVCGLCPWEGEGTDGVPSHWAITFGVANLDDALATLDAEGGRVTWGPQEIPFGRVASSGDPQGGPLNILELAKS